MKVNILPNSTVIARQRLISPYRAPCLPFPRRYGLPWMKTRINIEAVTQFGKKHKIFLMLLKDSYFLIPVYPSLRNNEPVGWR
jgi:hypothetical protein